MPKSQTPTVHASPARPALFVEIDEATRWAVRRAAVDARTSVRRLVGTIVHEWLVSAGYLAAEPLTDPHTTGAAT